MYFLGARVVSASLISSADRLGKFVWLGLYSDQAMYGKLKNLKNWFY